MDQCAGRMPGLDLLAKDELDFGRIFLRHEGEDGGMESFEHFGGELMGVSWECAWRRWERRGCWSGEGRTGQT